MYFLLFRQALYQSVSTGPIEAQQGEWFALSDIISTSAVLESIIQVGLVIGGWMIMTYRVKKRDYFP